MRTKVCILGGGPAGTTASLFLSRYGIAHILVDKYHFPRDKVCGESFDGRVYRLLEELSPGAVAALQKEQRLLPTWNYRFASKKVDLSVTFPASDLPRLSIERLQLDHYLWQQAGRSEWATVLSGVSLKATAEETNCIRLQGVGLQIDTDLVINATGAQAVPANDPSLFVFSRTYFEGVSIPREQGLEVKYFYDPLPVCLFMCPLSEGRYNVELAISREDYIRMGQPMDAIWKAILENNHDLRQRFTHARALGKSKGTSLTVQSRINWSAPGVIYTGSSAFTTNPITGLGVGNAMSMGKLAAELIRQYHDHPDFIGEVTRRYHKVARKKYRNILLLNRAVNFIQRHFRLLEPALAWGLRLRLVQQSLLKKDLTKGLIDAAHRHISSTQ
ncbi:MAG: NAD(P)/FAD-dependent oxidoreductase [Saprospiraceae bacterium]|nr:NAD(P)/FAD-dependent oxidoreductase [Lewinella sp.]